MSTSIVDEIVPKLRRAIDDTETPYMYKDTILAEYIEDAIDGLLLDYQHDYVVDRVNHTIEPDVTPAEQILFVMKGKLDLLERQPDMSFSAGSLSVTRKSDDKKQLRKEIKKAINNLKTSRGIGINNTEFDSFEDRIADWLYIDNM